MANHGLTLVPPPPGGKEGEQISFDTKWPSTGVKNVCQTIQAKLKIHHNSAFENKCYLNCDQTLRSLALSLLHYFKPDVQI
jgi:hypothetical protein